MAVTTSSSPFLDTLINDLAVVAWDQGKGDPSRSSKIYERLLDDLVNRTVRAGVAQEAQSASQTATRGALDAEMGRKERFHADKTAMDKKLGDMKVEVLERAAALNSLGALIAVGVKAGAAIYNRNQADSAATGAAEVPLGTLQNAPGAADQAGLIASRAQGISLDSPESIQMEQPQLGADYMAKQQPFAEGFLGSQLAQPEGIEQPALLADTSLQKPALLGQAVGPSAEGVEGKGFRDEQDTFALQNAATAALTGDQEISKRLEEFIGPMLDEVLTFNAPVYTEGGGPLSPGVLSSDISSLGGF
tara:strand:+ start:3602 stop:4516 length:915 start_codon:yes stop_codon:yes gene_type:complete